MEVMLRGPIAAAGSELAGHRDRAFDALVTGHSSEAGPNSPSMVCPWRAQVLQLRGMVENFALIFHE